MSERHERYPDNIRPDQIYTVPIVNGELHLSPAHDFLHYFPWLDQWMLKYWNSESEPPTFCDVIIKKEAAEFLVSQLDMEVCCRTFITESEIERVRQFGAQMLESEFGEELKDIDGLDSEEG